MKNSRSNKQTSPKTTPIQTPRKDFRHIHELIILLLVCVFYCDTLTLNYALDDRMVIMESKPVLQGGWDGIKSIFTEDTFSGFFGGDKSLVAGGRYRPLSQFTFLVEMQLFGQDVKSKIGDVNDFEQLHNSENEQYFVNSHLPFVSHLFNLIYFALLCLLIYAVLKMVFERYTGEKWYMSLAFLAAVLFAIHPIHTEAVANVKGRDEIFAMLGAMGALWCCLKYADKHKWWYLLLAFVAMLFGMFSKENAITFLAVVPLTLYFWKNDNVRKMDYLWTLLPLVLASVVFIIVRYHVLGSMMPEDQTQNILNNPFVNSSKADELATVLLTWAIYFKLLVFPHPLTHDYYPWQMQVSSFSNPLVWVVVLACAALIFFAVRGFKKRSIPSYAILFFIITFSITSNFLFNVGTFMNERFVFIPSLGFTLIVGYGFYRLFTSKTVSLQKFSMGVLILICLLCGIKTVARNLVWKDDFTLFLTDVKTSSNSIKCNISAGGSELQLWKMHHKERDKKLAYEYLDKALKLDNHALNAYILLGELCFLDGNYAASYQSYVNAATIDPGNEMVKGNLELAANKLHASEFDQVNEWLAEGRVDEALAFVNNKLAENPDDIIALNVKGNVIGRGYQRYDEAIAIYKRVLEKDPGFSSAWENMAIAHALKGEVELAEKYFLKAHELSPDDQNVVNNLKMLYQQMGHPEKGDNLK